MTTESSEGSTDTDNNSPETAVSEDPGLEATEGAGTSPSESTSPQATPSKFDENRAPRPWGWARLGLAVSTVVAHFVGSFYFSRFIRRKALAFIRAHITESRPWTVYGVLVVIVRFALSFNEDKHTAKLDARLKALA